MTRLAVAGAAAVMAVAMVGCTDHGTRAGSAPGSPGSNPPVSSSPHPGGLVCVSTGNGLPDPGCTPGAFNPAVTQETIGDTICRSGWTATVRPPRAYTDAVKRAMIGRRVVTVRSSGHTATVRPYGPYAGTSTADYELDHLVPLELGGDPWDVRNLWLEAEPGGRNPKDAVEGQMKRAVCDGRISLDAARRAMAQNWTSAGSLIGTPG